MDGDGDGDGVELVMAMVMVRMLVMVMVMVVAMVTVCRKLVRCLWTFNMLLDEDIKQNNTKKVDNDKCQC